MLLDVALNLLVELLLLLSAALLHLVTVLLDTSVVLCSSRWLFNLLVTLLWATSRVSTALHHRWVDHLVLLIHVLAKLGTWSGLIELERKWNRWLLRLLLLLHLGDE